jgi:hypothetical protein
MRIAKILAWVGLIAMTIALLNGFINGSFTEDGSMILNNPWGIVSLVDLYVGFILFAMWMGFREKSLLHSILWITSLMVLGFFIGSLYVLVSLYKSQNDWLTFFLGSRKESLLNSQNSVSK